MAFAARLLGLRDLSGASTRMGARFKMPTWLVSSTSGNVGYVNRASGESPQFDGSGAVKVSEISSLVNRDQLKESTPQNSEIE